MTSLEELFCQIDDFCQSFEPQWQTTLLGKGLKHRQRRRCLCLSEVMTILISFHQQSYRNFLAFLWETCLSLFATSVSRTAQLSTVCRLDTIKLDTFVRLSQTMLWAVHWHQLHRCHQLEGVPQSTNFGAPCLWPTGGEGQNLGRLVVWFQAPCSRQ